MSVDQAVGRFKSLVEKVALGTTARSENDLSSNLSSLLRSLGLATVIDTSVAATGRKRPDILVYVSGEDADLVLPAEIVLEAKKPEEVAEFSDLSEAMASDWIWEKKTLPYIRANIARIHYFVLTTFVDFAILPVTADLRREFIAVFGGRDDATLRQQVQNRAVLFQLSPSLPPSDSRSGAAWWAWIETHFVPKALQPVSISDLHNALTVRTRRDLENFATRLADFAAGASDERLANAGLYHSIRASLASDYAHLDALTKRDLHVFLMTQHPGMSLSGVETLAREKPIEVVTEFVAASIHSFIGRMFAFKAIEDIFCIREPVPLIPKDHWIFCTTRYNGKDPEQIRTEVFAGLRRLKESAPAAIQRFAGYGFFFDWIERYVDPVLFRSLLEMFASHDFDAVEGDLLGRFFEIYAQKVNRTKRKALGQYYTPQPVVDLIWFLALKIVQERNAIGQLNVLDPGMGSGTFLTQGARLLARLGIQRFWEKLTGFDISAQVLGIAYVNLYIAILSELDRNIAESVGDLKVYATDALDPRNGQFLRQILPLIPDEDYKSFIEQRIQISAEVKRTGAFTLIIGNPPYKNNSNLTLSQVAEVFPPLLESSVREARAQERNPRDDYAWFFAAADHYVTDSGVIAFIVSDSFAQNLSYRYFRQDLLRRYHLRQLIRLGPHIFQDVGPRTSFAIIILEKRSTVLDSPDDAEAHPYANLRDLIVDAPLGDLGTEVDPRFQAMRAMVDGSATVAHSCEHKPSADRNYSFYPGTSINERVKTHSLPVFAKGADRLFVEKWPGLITAFDELLKARTAEKLSSRIKSLYEVSSSPGLNGSKLTSETRKWGTDNGISDDNLERLGLLVVQIRQKHLSFHQENIKRALEGAMPNSVRWYPPKSKTVYVYYEVGLDIPRNQNEGKFIGWGSMQQWRDPASHLIRPKLIYTTAAKPNYGLKAFVVDDEWYVKIHGGTSQQYHYTGLHNPSAPARMDERPNNLMDGGLALLDVIEAANLPAEALNFYVASLYNSEVAIEFLEQAGSGTPFGIKIPGKSDLDLVRGLCIVSRRMRDLFWVKYIAEGCEILDLADLDVHFSPEVISELGFKKQQVSSRKFKTRELYEVPSNVVLRIEELAQSMQSEIDEMVADLYSG
jgi:hypothetical protein